MKNTDKTKEQLINELAELRQVITVLEESEPEHRRTAQVLRKSIKRYRSLIGDVLDSSSMGIFVLDSDFKVVMINNALELYFGLQRENVVGKDKRQLIEKRIKNIFEDHESFSEKVLATYDNNTYIENFECHVLGEVEREERWLEHWSQPIISGIYAGGRIEHYTDITLRKRAEEALRESEERLRTITDTALDSIFCKDINRRYTFVNPSMLQLLDCTKADLIGKVPEEVFDKEDAAIVTEVDERTLNGENISEVRSLSIAGKPYTFHTIQVPLCDSGGNITGISGIVRDVTDFVQAQEALGESVEKYRGLVEGLNETVYRMSLPDGKYEYVSPSVKDVFGYSAEEFINKPLLISKIIHPDFLDYFQEKWTELIGGEVAPNYEYKIIDPEGNERWIFQSNKGIFDKRRNIIAIEGICRNISFEKQAEETLRKSEEKYRTLFEGSRDAVYITTLDGKYVDFNQSMLDLFGYSREEMMGIEVQETYAHPVDRNRFQKEIEKKGFVREHELKLRKKDGTEMDCLLTGTVRRASDGSILGYQGIIRDITDRKQAEEEKTKLEVQLRQAQKMEAIGTLAGGIAHDFNNILAAIIGYTELALLDVPEGSLAKRNLDGVFNAGGRAKDLVKQILAFSRQSEQERRPLQINLIIKEALKMLRASLPATIKIQQNIKAGLSTVLADPIQIHQVIMNLCTNAAHAMHEKGCVLEVSLADVDLDSKAAEQHPDLTLGQYQQLIVSDTGHGMDRVVMERIFEPFFTTKEPGRGTGMGLAVVHGIVKSYGGAITVYSEPEKGTTFHVYLPRIEREVTTEPEEMLPLPMGKERILFVDDEPAIVDIGKQMLASLGYTVETRTSPIEALEAFRAQPDKFDLVITNMTMPNMTGDKLAKELMAMRPDMSIILCTGFSEIITEEKAKAMGIRAFAMKPFVMRDLANAVRKALD